MGTTKNNSDNSVFSQKDPFDWDYSRDFQWETQIESWIESKRDVHLDEMELDEYEVLFHD
jgi:hypothetical protein